MGKKAAEVASPAASAKRKSGKVKEELPASPAPRPKRVAAAKEAPRPKKAAKKAAAKPDPGAARYWQQLAKTSDQKGGAGAGAEASGVAAPAQELPPTASSEAAQELPATPSETVPPAEPPAFADELPETVPAELPLCPVAEPAPAPAAPVKEPEQQLRLELDYASVPLEEDKCDEYLHSWFERDNVVDLDGEILRVKSHPWFLEHYNKVLEDVGDTFDWGSPEGDQIEDLKEWIRWYQHKCANPPMPQSAAEAACPPSPDGPGPESVGDSEFWVNGLAAAFDQEKAEKDESMEPGGLWVCVMRRFGVSATCDDMILMTSHQL